MSHRFSGWPGAWCLDCGISDPLEEALACPDCDLKCGPDDPASDKMCPVHAELLAYPCSMPGSNRHNPYEDKS